jgi:hypothetical protein
MGAWPEREQPVRDAWSAVPAITGTLAAGLGSIVLFGWLLNDVALISVVPGFATMKVNTAIGLLLCGLSLIWPMRPLSLAVDWLGRGMACLASVVGLLAALEYLLNTNLGVDQLLFRDTVTPAAELPGRMSLVAAISFVMFGCGR